MPLRRKALYLTHHGPLPASSGGRLRDAALIARLAKLADLEVWAISRTPAQDSAALAGYEHPVRWRVYRDEGPVRSYPTRESAAAAADLADRAEKFDVIHVEGHYLSHLVPERCRDRAVVVEHNVESHLLAQRSRIGGETGPAADDLPALLEREEAVWRATPSLVTLSREDRARIIERVPTATVEVIGNGADHVPRLRPRPETTSGGPPVIGFLANYLYPPNLNALSWLLTDLFPAISARLPGCRLLLAGSNLAPAVAGRTMPGGVIARGWFDDLTRFWTMTDVVVCPLRVGGGVKVKMLEALRSGALTVATSVGVEGLPPSAHEAIERADTAGEFVSATVRLCTDPSSRRAMRERLARVQDDLPTWQGAAESLYRYWSSTVAAHGGA